LASYREDRSEIRTPTSPAWAAEQADIGGARRRRPPRQDDTLASMGRGHRRPGRGVRLAEFGSRRSATPLVPYKKPTQSASSTSRAPAHLVSRSTNGARLNWSRRAPWGFVSCPRATRTDWSSWPCGLGVRGEARTPAFVDEHVVAAPLSSLDGPWPRARCAQGVIWRTPPSSGMPSGDHGNRRAAGDPQVPCRHRLL